MGRGRVFRRAVLVAGAAGSIILMLIAGRRNPSWILRLLFAGWVLSPFVAAAFADVLSERRPEFWQRSLHVAMVVLTVASLAIYGYMAFGHPSVKLGFVFLVVPFASLLLMVVIAAIAIRIPPTTD
jgi:ACR3 family arsenite efflux pump ArsB